MESKPKDDTGEITAPAYEFISWKLSALDLAFRSQRYRERIISIFNHEVANAPERTDVIIVLGTSILKFPDKFKKRVYLATKLALSGRGGFVIFTGLKDHETADLDQGADAMRLAIENFGLPKSMCIAVGGDNTQENFAQVDKLLTSRFDVSSAFVVSDSRHLLRALHVADYEMRFHGIRLYPKPTDYFQPLDPNNPLVIMEIIKTLAYHRSLYHIPKIFNERDRQSIRTGIDLAVNRYSKEVLHGSNQIQLGTELPFDNWLKAVDGSE